MNTQLGYIKSNGNVVFVENNVEKIAHLGKGRIFENNSDFKTTQAIAAGLPLVDVTVILADIKAHNAAVFTEQNRVAAIKSQWVNVATFKLSQKEKNKVKKQVAETATQYYIGSVTVTDSSRGKGGYFKYSDSVIDGIFYINEWKGISKMNAGEVVSSRKKNYSTNYKAIDAAEVVKILVKEIEAKENLRLQKEAKEHNANLMLDNLDIFRSQVFAQLTK